MIKEKIKSKLINRNYPGLLKYPSNFELKTVSLYIGEGSIIEPNSRIESSGTVEIGQNTRIQNNCDFAGDIKIGDFCAIARRCTFQGINHNYQALSVRGGFGNGDLEKDEIEVGNDVWIGVGATILPGVTIEDGAIIGADAVVTKDVSCCEIVAGNPAQNIGWRFKEEKRELYKKTRWWEKDSEDIKKLEEILGKELPTEELKNLLVD